MTGRLDEGLALLDRLPAMIAVIDRHGRYVYANRAYARLFGADPSAIVGRTLCAHLGAHLGEPARRRAAACIARALGGETACLSPLAAPQGARQTYRMTCVPYGEGDAPPGAFAVIEAAGEPEREAQDAGDAPPPLDDIVARLPAVVFQYERGRDGAARLNYLSPQAEAWVGIDTERIKADPDLLGARLPPGGEPPPGRTERSGDRRDEVWSWQGRLKRGTHRRFVRALASAHHPAPDREVWNGLLLDADDQKHVERMLKETAAFFHDIATTIPGIVYRFVRTADGRRRFDYVSPRIADMLGLSAQDVLADARVLLDRIYPDDRAALKQRTEQALEDLTPLTWEGRILTADGETVWVHCNSQPRRQGDGSIVWSGVAIDTSERKRAEEELHEARKMEAVGQLTGGLAHDFNNLLAVVGGNLELLEEDLADRPRLQAMATKARRTALRGSEVTQRLLAFARRQPLSPRVVDVNELIDRTAELLDRAVGREVAFTTSSLAARQPVLVDPGQLENALINLAMNARDAMSAGGEIAIETADVELDAACATRWPEVAPGRYTLVSVSDTGAGMPPEVADRAFQPFFTTKRSSKGSGLGLSMVYGFVKQSGGHAVIRSAEGRGTTVHLYLPQARASATAPQSPPPREATARPGECVLLVENEDDLRSSLAAMLMRLGYRLLVAADAASALARIDTAPRIDLLVSDIVLGAGMNGCQLAEAARARRDLAVVLASGHPGGTDAGDLHDLVDGPLLQKPFCRHELATRVREAIDRHWRRR